MLTLPADITVEAATSAGTVVTFTATATDDVDGNVPVVCTPAPGSTFALGTTAVNCTATDTHGNSANGSFQVHVIDTTAPVIVSITATPGSLWPPNHKMVDVVVTVDVSDGSSVTAMIVGVTSSDTEDNNNTSPDWIITGDLTLQLRSERSNPDKERKYTIEVEVTDAGGLRTVGTVVVGVLNEPRPEEVTAHGTLKTKRR